MTVMEESIPGQDDIPMPAFIQDALNDRGLMDAYMARPPWQQKYYPKRITKAMFKNEMEDRLHQMLEELDGGRKYMNRHEKSKSMEWIEWIIKFSSTEFRPCLPKDPPGDFWQPHYGFELTYWLSRKLAERGIFTSYPDVEWDRRCWVIWLQERDSGLNSGLDVAIFFDGWEKEEGAGKPITWWISVTPYSGKKEIFDPGREMSNLTDAIEAALAAMQEIEILGVEVVPKSAEKNSKETREPA